MPTTEERRRIARLSLSRVFVLEILRLSSSFFQTLCQKVRDCSKQNDNRNIIDCKKNVAAFQVEEEKLLLENKIFPDSAGDESVNAVSADEGEKNAGKDFCRNVLKEASNMQSDMQRHKKIIPVAGKQMGNAGKAQSTLNVQKSKKMI